MSRSYDPCNFTVEEPTPSLGVMPDDLTRFTFDMATLEPPEVTKPTPKPTPKPAPAKPAKPAEAPAYTHPTTVPRVAAPPVRQQVDLPPKALTHHERHLPRAENAARQLIRSWIENGPRQLNHFDPDRMPTGPLQEVAGGVLDAMLNNGVKDYAGCVAYFTAAPQPVRDELAECAQGFAPLPSDCGPLLSILRDHDRSRQRETLAHRLRAVLDRCDDTTVILREIAEFESAGNEGDRGTLMTGVKTTAEIRAHNVKDDPSAMIGHQRRFLGKGGSFAVIGPSGIGKSTLITGIIIHAAAGMAWHGITFREPMKTLVIQAENDDGDLKEMIEGALLAVGFDKSTADLAGRNIKWKRETSRTGEKFTRWLEEIIRETGAQLVVIDPLLSFVGDDISQQKVASQFFRNWLQPVLERTGAIVLLVHHTGKTSTDSKSRQNWSESDFAYLGIGSSELTNWARAVAVLIPHGVDTGRFKFLIAKRGSRAGMIDQFSGEHSTSIYLKHAAHGLGWVQAERPDESESTPRSGGRKQKVTPEDVMRSLGPATHAKRKDILVADLMLDCAASERSVRERVDALILAGRIHIAETTPRDGGGHPHDWLRAAPSAIGNNQRETSD